jgi:poly(3-hydroxyoctanoate) depolymerase
VALYGGILRLERDLLQVHAAAMRGPSLRGYLYQLLAVRGWTSWHRLHRVKARAVGLVRKRDEIMKNIAAQVLAIANDCNHILFPAKFAGLTPY